MSVSSIFITLLTISLAQGIQVSTEADAVVSSGGAIAIAAGSDSSVVSLPEAVECPCNDEPPKSAAGQPQFTCAEQKKFGKCDADFMLGFCECTCDRCCPCNDFPPLNDQLTCVQQKELGQCDAPFMAASCECVCDRCQALGGTPTPATEVVDDEPQEVSIPAISPTPVPTPALTTSCPSGSRAIFGSSDCESVRCAQNRQKCANRCGGLNKIKFDCKDVTDGNSSAFSSSCACA